MYDTFATYVAYSTLTFDPVVYSIPTGKTVVVLSSNLNKQLIPQLFTVVGLLPNCMQIIHANFHNAIKFNKVEHGGFLSNKFILLICTIGWVNLYQKFEIENIQFVVNSFYLKKWKGIFLIFGTTGLRICMDL